jgi:hypothetical protein
MPSMHIGWSLWSGIAILLYAQRRWARVLGLLYPSRVPRQARDRFPVPAPQSQPMAHVAAARTLPDSCPAEPAGGD